MRLAAGVLCWLALPGCVTAWRYQCCQDIACDDGSTVGCNTPCQVVYYPTFSRAEGAHPWENWFSNYSCSGDRHMKGHVSLLNHYICNISLEHNRRMTVACFCREHKCNNQYLYEIMQFADDKLANIYYRKVAPNQQTSRAPLRASSSAHRTRPIAPLFTVLFSILICLKHLPNTRS